MCKKQTTCSVIEHMAYRANGHKANGNGAYVVVPYLSIYLSIFPRFVFIIVKIICKSSYGEIRISKYLLI